MTDKELIYNILLNGIPYGIMGSVTHHDEETNEPVEIGGQIKGIRSNGYVEFYYPDGSFNLFRITDVKPYLRPMSTMSSKERRELRQWGSLCMTEKDIVEDVGVYGAIHSIPAIDWFNKYHFDYRGMIDMELALPAKDGMYSPPIWAFVPTGGRY